jgi:glycosyltransferase involved in cell wall biosynthesis
MKNLSTGNIVIVSTCYIDWGGSEELWSGSIPFLQRDGFKLVVYKHSINRLYDRFLTLSDMGVKLTDYKSTLMLPVRILHRIRRFLRKTYAESKKQRPALEPDEAFAKNLKKIKPRLVIISQGINFDGLVYAHQCLLMNIPYILISHKAVDFYWPDFQNRAILIRAYQQSKNCFFVSQHNRRLTEEQLGTRLPNSEVIFNPVKTSRQIVPYPSTEAGFRLACVARLFLLDKGQDILIRILSKEKWKKRPLHISFIGSGDDREPLVALAKLLDVGNISFMGQINNIETVWNDHHALILPSRSEGMPITIIEAMAGGRVVILTNAGGSAEYVSEGETGFVGKIDQDMFEEAMERAWSRRQEWKDMGLAAARFIKETVPQDPAFEFSKKIKGLVYE